LFVFIILLIVIWIGIWRETPWFSSNSKYFQDVNNTSCFIKDETANRIENLDLCTSKYYFYCVINRERDPYGIFGIIYVKMRLLFLYVSIIWMYGLWSYGFILYYGLYIYIVWISLWVQQWCNMFLKKSIVLWLLHCHINLFFALSKSLFCR
jgi:hypothetical protein